MLVPDSDGSVTATVIGGSSECIGSRSGPEGVGGVPCLTDAWRIARLPGTTAVLVVDGSAIQRYDPITGSLALIAGAIKPGSPFTTTDGIGAAARFVNPRGLAVNAAGTLAYIADGPMIRQLDLQTGAVTTLAGDPAMSEVLDGTGTAAHFKEALWLALTGDGSTAIIADDHTLRSLNLTTLAVTTLAGIPSGPYDYQYPQDGVGAEVRFGTISGFALSPDSAFVYTAEQPLCVVRTFEVATLTATTIAGNDCPGSQQPSYDGSGTTARLDAPHGLAVSQDGTTLYVVEEGSNHKLRRIDLATAAVTTLAGYERLARNITHISVDGVGADAGFDHTQDLLLTNDGASLLITERHGAVRRFDLASNGVSTLMPSDTEGTNDGPGLQARFGYPRAVGISADGQLGMVSDDINNTMRRIDLDGITNTVTTVAGDPRYFGYAPGAGRAAHFAESEGIAVSMDGSFAVVADSDNHVLRRVDTHTGVTELLAGQPNVDGYANGIGTAAQLSYPNAVAISADGSFALFVDAGQYSYVVRRLDLVTKEVTLLAGNPYSSGGADGVGAAATFRWPRGIAISGDGSFALVVDSNAVTIRRIELATGAVTTIAGAYRQTGNVDDIGTAARFGYPFGIGLTADGRYAYISDYDNNTIRRLDVATNRVTTMAGLAGAWGVRDGTGSAARFGDIMGLAINAAGTRGLVVDENQNIVQRLDIRAPLGASGVIRETWTAITASGVLSLTVPFTDSVVGHSPLARGPLVLSAALFSREPGSQPRDGRQLLADAQSRFTIEATAVPVSLTTPQAAYRRDLTATGADDAAAAIPLLGEVRNTTTQPADLTLTLTRDGTAVFSHTFPAVAPGMTAAWSVVDRSATAGTLRYAATTALGTAVLNVSVELPAVKATITGPSDPLVVGQAATIQAVAANLGHVPGLLTVNFGAAQETLLLAVGQTITLTHALTPTEVGYPTVPVTLTGDLERTSVVYLTVEDHTVGVAPQLVGTLRTTDTLLLEPGARLELALSNADQNWFDVVADYQFTGPAPQQGQQVISLSNGSGTLTLPLADLPPGAYTLTYQLRDALSRVALGNRTLTFTLVIPRVALDLQLSSAPRDAAQTDVTALLQAAPDNDLSWYGELQLTGALLDTSYWFLTPGATEAYSLTLPVADLAGPQVVTATLVSAGRTVAEHALTINAVPRAAPQLTLVDVAATPAAPGAVVTLTATLDNAGPAGDALLHLVAFDHDSEQLVAVGTGRSTVTLTALVPSALLAGTYPVAVRLGEQTVSADVVVAGPQIALTQALDQLSYSRYTTATWTVMLTATAAITLPYDVALRYGGAAFTSTVTLAPGVATAVSWPFNVGPVADRATVLVSNHPTGDAVRYSLVIDSRWVPVIEDDHAWLASDRPSYSAGDTVALTLHLMQPTRLATISAPSNLPGHQGEVLWSSLAITPTVPVAQGDFTITVPLSATLATGRYFFRYTFDGEQRTLPVDIHGVAVEVEQLAVQGAAVPLAARGLSQPTATTPVTVTAQLRADQPVAAAEVRAVQVAPDGTISPLLASAPFTLALAAGVTPLTLTGVLSTTTTGTYHVALLVRAGDTHAQLGGRTVAVDVGGGYVSAVTTDHGVYDPGRAGYATMSLAGTGPVSLTVTTSDGTVLLQRSFVVAGFATVTTPVPTLAVGPEVVIATVTDGQGRLSRQQAAYSVVAVYDWTPPAVSITTPRAASTVPYISASPLISVTGLVTETDALRTVLVNGEPATVVDGQWTATVYVEPGFNSIEAVAVDGAGNQSAPALIGVVAEPGYGLQLAASPMLVPLGSVVTYQAVVTATESLTLTARFPFSASGLEFVTGSATSGAVVSSTEVLWTGPVTAGTPVTITWTARATTALKSHTGGGGAGARDGAAPQQPGAADRQRRRPLADRDGCSERDRDRQRCP